MALEIIQNQIARFLASEAPPEVMSIKGAWGGLVRPMPGIPTLTLQKNQNKIALGGNTPTSPYLESIPLMV